MHGRYYWRSSGRWRIADTGNRLTILERLWLAHMCQFEGWAIAIMDDGLRASRAACAGYDYYFNRGKTMAHVHR